MLRILLNSFHSRLTALLIFFDLHQNHISDSHSTVFGIEIEKQLQYVVEILHVINQVALVIVLELETNRS